MNPDTTVILYDVTEHRDYPTVADKETETWRGSYSEFLANNELAPVEVAMIEAGLTQRGCYYFGGGAQPLTVLRRLA